MSLFWMLDRSDGTETRVRVPAPSASRPVWLVSCQYNALSVHCVGREVIEATKKAASVVLRNATGATGGKAMAVGLQPSQLLAACLQMERQADLTLFKLTADAQERLEDLLVRR